MEFLKVISTDNNPVPIDYAIYPSLLDAYLRYKKNDDDETFDSLFDKINKVKTEQTEAQLKGVEFEMAINSKLKGLSLLQDNDSYITGDFTFKIDLIDKIVERLQFSTSMQKYMEVIIHTHVGNIKLYGIVDYDFPEMITDLKTTSNYKCNKYEDNTQHSIYSLIRKLKGKPLKAFKYLVTDFEKVYQETYIPTDNMFNKLMLTIFEFINFINHFKTNITDEKIFGSETRSIKSTIALPEVR